MREIGADEFVRKFRALMDAGESRVALFLGAGCSVSSGILGAGALVTNEWLPRLMYQREGHTNELAEWAASEFPGYTSDTAARFYGDVIEALFLNAEERQAEIERLTDGRDPRFGYAVLAQLMSEGEFGKHVHIVLTTNFDDMVADALYLYTRKRPLVIAHESLTGFVRVTGTRPLIVKLHGDARLAPRNTRLETKQLKNAFTTVLRKLVAETGVIFIGYGGGDESITRVFAGTKPPWGVYWVNEARPASALGDWLEEIGGVWVRHRDFDELMLLVQDVFGLQHPNSDRFEEVFKSYKLTFLDVQKGIQSKLASRPNLPDREAFEQAAEKSASDFGSWVALVLEAYKYEATDLDKAEALYRKGLDSFGQSAELVGQYARFLAELRKDHVQAEQYYRRAIDADPVDATNLGNYALFLKQSPKDLDQAEEYYRRAIEADPSHANNLGNYASFLADQRKAPDQAEEYYRRAIEADPSHANNLGNYASFLADSRKDFDQAEQYYRRAIEADPSHANNLGNYAIFLTYQRKAPDQAEEYYRRAIEADQTHGTSLSRYASFLADQRMDLDRAEEHYRRAIEVEPTNANSLGSYALFLAEQRKDPDQAEEYHRRAMEADPSNADLLGNYAVFLAERRKDLGQAEEYYRRAIEADPSHANNLGNYASFLTNQRKHLDKAEEYYRRAIEVDPTNANNLGGYAIFLAEQRNDLGQADEYYSRAIEAEPTNAINLGNYAGFLLALGNSDLGLDMLHRAISGALPGSPLQLECSFYGYAHEPSQDERNHHLDRLRVLIADGVRSPDWNLTDNVERAIRDGHPEARLLSSLAKVIADQASSEELRQFQAWSQDG